MKFRAIEIKFELRDLWVGIYWNYNNDGYYFGKWQKQLDIYICLIPILPIHIEFHS